MSRKANLWIHDERFSKLDIVINPEHFPDVKVGDLIEIVPAKNAQSEKNSEEQFMPRSILATDPQLHTGTLQERFIIQIVDIDTELVSKQSSLHLSLAHHSASLFDFQPRKDVIISKVEIDLR